MTWAQNQLAILQKVETVLTLDYPTLIAQDRFSAVDQDQGCIAATLQ
jgi:hypothetical protein